MKLPSLLAISLAGNLALAAIFIALRMGSAAKTNASSPATGLPATLTATKPSPTATETPVPVVPWRLIASADYRQYIANLRGVGCPEWLIRDIIVADIDDLYEQKSRTDPVHFEPWQGVDQRRQSSHLREAKLKGLRQQKLALVKSLLGYEWENYAEQVWNQDLLTSLTLGYLPYDKSCQVVSLRKQSAEAAQNIREDANFILIDDDRARLLSLYEGYEADLSQRLDTSELDELQLRDQQGFLLANDINFAGVTISSAELRELVRRSKSFRDMVRSDFVPDRPLSDAEQIRWRTAFDAQVKSLLGPEQFADYQRAQDFKFREIFQFSQQNDLPQTAAIQVYEARQNAAEEADEFQKDRTLSANERAAALVLLKDTTMITVSSALGGSFQNYLAGPGEWLSALAPGPETQGGGETQ